MVRKVLVALRAYYNWVVVDAPGDLSEHVLSALDFADKVLRIVRDFARKMWPCGAVDNNRHSL
jgi:MinD-like ATPase involved in chromosome partitioning or flagellar assembly